jgi:hypothetical protein
MEKAAVKNWRLRLRPDKSGKTWSEPLRVIVWIAESDDNTISGGFLARSLFRSPHRLIRCAKAFASTPGYAELLAGIALMRRAPLLARASQSLVPLGLLAAVGNQQ